MNIEKMLTELRAAVNDARSKMSCQWDSPAVNKIHIEVYDLLTKTLSAFTAEMPGAIGDCVRILNEIRETGIMIRHPDEIRAALAKLEGK